MNFRNKYVLAIDQGTTSSRAILFNHQGTIITLAQKPFQQYFPKPGWVEHDPNEIWYTQSSVIKEAMAKADVTDSHIACIGIANQREMGQAKISIFIALLRKVILLIPLALLLPHFMGVTGVYAAEAVSDATAAICCTLLFIWKFPKILGKIKKKEERAAQ